MSDNTLKKFEKFDKQALAYIGVKMIKFGKLLINTAYIGGACSAIMCAFTYPMSLATLRFATLVKNVGIKYEWGYNDQNMKYHDIANVQSRVDLMQNWSRYTTMVGAGTLVCGVVGGALEALGEYIWCRTGDDDYYRYKYEKLAI